MLWLKISEGLRWQYKTYEHKFHNYWRSTNETIIANTEYGQVRGSKRISIYDVPYYSFEGIPYAQPPLGELRFRAPQPPKAWAGIRDCRNIKDKATQMHFLFDSTEGTEDCLYLNVYTNNVTPAKPRPVMVWIHGGGFQIGEASHAWHGPDYFIKEDVIFISIQFRLGPLGFLSLKSPELNVPGNAGLKDQLMALKWIKKNCSHFGGDPNCITVFGESAGGTSVNYLMLTDQAKGLFHRGILQSGCAVAPWAFNGDITHRAYRLAKASGYKGPDNDKDVLDYLLKAKATDLMYVAEHDLKVEERNAKTYFLFGPSLEPYETADCMLPKQPIELLKNCWGNSIPMMAGNTSYEGLIFMPEVKFFPSVVKHVDIGTPFIPAELMATKPSEQQITNWSTTIRNAYRTEKLATPHNYMELCSMHYFVFPMMRVANARLSDENSAPLYIYRYDFDSEKMIYPYRIKRLGRGVKGVCHADDLAYLFASMHAYRLPKESREYRNIERTIAIWTQFAATGNPNTQRIPEMDTWHPANKSDKVLKCLNISDDLKFIDMPEWPHLKIWESLYDGNEDLILSGGKL
ncbi:esterase B1-like [Drosophila tropicalis]|uniref:esterase B1-like n=1 Tax=Drosophila tropicalis TaxID=46794 RepID=UPI0035ABC6AB